MRFVHGIIFGICVLACGAASAQQGAIHERMSAEQFRAAGLDKLDPAELAQLDAWFAAQLGGRQHPAGEQTLAVPHPAALAQEPVDSTLAGTFEGFSQGREYQLANGQVWKQTDATQTPGARRRENPSVEIRPGRLGSWWLRIDGLNTRARVERVR